MRIVNVTYHQEKEGWWAESIDAPSFFAAGATRDEVRQHVRDHLPQVVGDVIEEYRDVEIAATTSVAAADESKLASFVLPTGYLVMSPAGGVY